MLRLTCMSLLVVFAMGCTNTTAETSMRRQSLNSDWKFTKDDPAGTEGKLAYSNVRQWVLPCGNDFNETARTDRPAGNIGEDVAYTNADFDDSQVAAIESAARLGHRRPVQAGISRRNRQAAVVGNRLVSQAFQASLREDAGKQIYLDIDGAMAYATVWINGQYRRRLALWICIVARRPHAVHQARRQNVLAIRLDNPPNSSRWYPGGGIYRNVWLTKTAPVHVGQWGTYITTPQVSIRHRPPSISRRRSTTIRQGRLDQAIVGFDL